MIFSLPLGWLQLKAQKLRLLSAILGISFAVVLIFVQLEFREALFVSAVRYHSTLDYGLIMVSPRTDYLISAREFPRNRLYQVQGMPEVSAVTPVYAAIGNWRNPTDRSRSRRIFILGFDPTDIGFARLITPEQHEQIKSPDMVIFDSKSREEYGPIVNMMATQGMVSTEVNAREVAVNSMYTLGTSFGLDGGIITSDLNFLRIFPKWKKSSIHYGLIHLEADADPLQVQTAVKATIPGDVLVLTPEEFKTMEVKHWNSTTPIGYIFAFGAVMGVVVGLIIVYQILFADVQDHLKEYATLQAMGYTPGYLRLVVLQEAVILAVLGFIPGLIASAFLFKVAGGATGLPLDMTFDNAWPIFVLTLAMCAGSGLLALRKLRGVDPAEVF
ncbi:MAG: ABC transporter permease DevC [Pseudomonadota bacterium]